MKINYKGKEIEVSKLKQYKGKLGDLKIPEGWKLLTIDIYDYLISNHLKEFNPKKRDVIIQNLGYNYNRGYSHAVAWFGAGSDEVVLDCYRVPQNSGSALGVAFWREINV